MHNNIPVVLVLYNLNTLQKFATHNLNTLRKFATYNLNTLRKFATYNLNTLGKLANTLLFKACMQMRPHPRLIKYTGLWIITKC